MNNLQNSNNRHNRKQVAENLLTPTVDIYETADELVLLADLPGVAESDLKLEVFRDTLTIEGAITNQKNKRQSSYYRQFHLAEEINGNTGNATLKDGVLTLRLAKVEQEKPKTIAVNTLH